MFSRSVFTFSRNTFVKIIGWHLEGDAVDSTKYLCRSLLRESTRCSNCPTWFLENFYIPHGIPLGIALRQAIATQMALGSPRWCGSSRWNREPPASLGTRPSAIAALWSCGRSESNWCSHLRGGFRRHEEWSWRHLCTSQALWGWNHGRDMLRLVCKQIDAGARSPRHCPCSKSMAPNRKPLWFAAADEEHRSVFI